MNYIRDESHWMLVSEPKLLSELNDCLLEGALWFLPVPKGAPIDVSEATMRKAQSKCHEFFGFQDDNFLQVPKESIFEWYASKIPSLKSMQTPKHEMVLSAWILLVLERPDLIAQVGPRPDGLDMPFVLKVLDCLKIS